MSDFPFSVQPPPAGEPAPEPAPEPAAEPAAAPEPAYVIVPRDQVEEYASRGYQPGYAMIRP